MFYKFNKETLKFEKTKGIQIGIKAFGVFIALLLVMGLNFKFTSKTNYSEAEVMVVVGRYNQFSEAKLIAEIKKMHFKYPEIILAQAKIETGNFTSPIFKINHNLFGMKEAQSRITTAQETQMGHARYENWKDSFYDYCIYYSSYLRKLDTEEEYYEYLSQNYAEDPHYVTTLKAMIAKENLKSKFN
jgi:uncharacterized FlgJ-related protein